MSRSIVTVAQVEKRIRLVRASVAFYAKRSGPEWSTPRRLKERADRLRFERAELAAILALIACETYHRK